jgi:molecular chaperone DnaJ
MGFLKMSQVLRMDIPPGVDTDTRLRVKGHGEMGKFGGPPGDLYVVIAIKKHPVFSRSGNDLSCEVPLSLSQAVQGGEIEVPILGGAARMKIPAGITPGKVLILKGQGMPASRGVGRGDLRITVRVDIPLKPTKRQREWLKELNRLNAGG